MVDVAARALSSAVAETPAEHGIDDMRFNDGKGAPGGELIIGRMHSKWRDGKPGRLYRCAPALCCLRTTLRCRPVICVLWGSMWWHGRVGTRQAAVRPRSPKEESTPCTCHL